MEKELMTTIVQQLQVKKNMGKGIMVTGVPTVKRNKNQNIYINEHPLDHYSEYHTHSFFEINYVLKGECVNLIEDDIVEMKVGDVVILHPGAFHTLYADRSCEVYNFIVNKDWFQDISEKIIPYDGALYQFLERVGKDDYYKYAVCSCKYDNPTWVAKAQRIIELRNCESNCIYILFESAMIEFLSALVLDAANAHTSLGRGSKDYKLINILMYMAENYATVTLEDVSEKFFYSKTHICRIFAQNTGKTFNQTLMQMKINHACIYLKNTDYSVEEISRLIGYDSCEYFQRLFKKSVGMTPGNFRRVGDTDKLLC